MNHNGKFHENLNLGGVKVGTPYFTQFCALSF